MITVMDPVHGEIDIPEWVVDLKSFRKWYHSGVLPEKLKVHFINGRVWVDLFMEEYFSHNSVRVAIGRTLAELGDRGRVGRFVADGMLYRNADADLGTEPDGMFVTRESFIAKKVSFTAGRRRGAQATELIGTPDIVIEVVSPSSVGKDTEWLMSQYHDAGVPEYWLIDARGDAIRFDIFTRRDTEYVPAPGTDGWVESPTFRRSFRLSRFDDDTGMTDYSLEAR